MSIGIMLRKTTAIGILAAQLTLSAGCPQPASKQTSPSVTSSPDQEIEHFTVVETKNGRRKYEAFAERVAIYKATSQVLASDLHVKFFSSSDETFSTLTADSGFIDDRTKDMRALGHVVVVTQDSTRLESQELVWEHQQEKIRADGFVKITRRQDILTGIGLETDPQLKNIEIKKDMRATVRSQDASKF